MEKQLRDGPQMTTIREEMAAIQRGRAELQETFKNLIRRLKWMNNMINQLPEIVATLREQTNFREDVNELPRGDGLGKDQIMGYFINNTRVVELPPAIQRDLDEMKANNLGYKVLADHTLKYLMIIEHLQ